MGRSLRHTFGVTPYLVGSCLRKKTFRDVDVRIMLEDEHYDRIIERIELRDLNLMLSLWGQKVTGLPIDCQIQHTTSANADFNGRRHPLGRERVPD